MKLDAALLTATVSIACLVGCGAPGLRAPATPAAAEAPAAAPQILKSSLYAKNASGALREDDLQRVLASPIDLQLPARLGVVPLSEPFDAEEPASIDTRSVAAKSLARRLVGSPYYSEVSDISTDLPAPGGIEGLRVLAARYRVRYLLLYSERFEDDTHLNGWAWLYPTLIGMFIAPGVTVESQGLAQAHLVDVRTGTVLLSAVEPMHVSAAEWMIGAARSHRKAQITEAKRVAKKLAKRVLSQTAALVAFADDAAHHPERVATRYLPPPIVEHPVATLPAAIGAAATAAPSPDAAVAE